MYSEKSIYRPVYFDSAVIVYVDLLIGNNDIILDVLTKFQEETSSFITSVSVCPSIRNNSVPNRRIS
jgi:hypothetical protein